MSCLIKVPLRFMQYASLTLLLTLFITIVDFSLELGNHMKFENRAPVNPRPVALEYLGGERTPIHSAKEWDMIYPPGKGFVKISGSYYLMAMYHQMHCVNAFRRTVEEYREGSNITSSREKHLIHCLEYLRQAVLCNADTSLEGPAGLRHTVGGETVHAVTGGGAIHECRDWTQVYDWVESNYEEWKEEDDFEVI
ncbi:hypothetical protein D9613_012369 [Agrocybe pediades]|uniref:Oxidase ustYa n=1 Tax=Agrocybe pediades TaxID=84607 RepID=A0A8H4VM56_9AGAR|nr:hypothetical protein D9613_012369 [Agrocybe pediades]